MKRIATLAVGTALIPLVVACSSTAASKPGSKAASTAASVAKAKASEAATTVKVRNASKFAATTAARATTKAAPPMKQYTVAQKNAIRSAQSYLEFSGFSKAGLIGQLSSKSGDGFKKSDAVFAVNHIKVDWNKEAVKSAKSYLEIGGFSRAGLIQQLSSKAGDKYTLSQAKYAADHVGL